MRCFCRLVFRVISGAEGNYLVVLVRSGLLGVYLVAFEIRPIKQLFLQLKQHLRGDRRIGGGVSDFV
jgi:hypothetical protein